MKNWSIIGAFIIFAVYLCKVQQARGLDGPTQIGGWQQPTSWRMVPTSASWSLHTKMPMLESDYPASRIGETSLEEGRGKLKVKKKFKKFLLPLLLAYKLKFFTLIPVLIGGLVLLTGATGLAGFFFALFAAVMGLKAGGH